MAPLTRRRAWGSLPDPVIAALRASPAATSDAAMPVGLATSRGSAQPFCLCKTGFGQPERAASKMARVARSDWGYAGLGGDRVAIEPAGGEAP